ncbi:hypothetical protein [Bacteroides acidifaciens]|uniref:hypothetical protein n=1 Tax=Bacteroides acidifaciens TaxID=85831 RepID=UPI0025A5762F|nr:hypothetical protein [Bacteroides acidifaciens]
MKQWKQTSVMIGLLLIEAIIMLYAVPKANEDEINMQMWLVIGLFFFLTDKFGYFNKRESR